jgi:ATP-binding cassette, subfamily B, bacterial
MPRNVPLRQYWDLLADHIGTQKLRFSLLTVLLVGSIGLQIVNPQITRYYIDVATSGAGGSRLITVALIFVGLALIQQAVGVGARYYGENVAWTATNALRLELAAHCLNLDMGFHGEMSPGKLIERIDGDVSQLSNFFSQLVIRIVGNLLLLIGILVALFREGWMVGAAFTVFAAVTLVALNAVRSLAIPHEKARREAESNLFGFLEERLAGTEDIRSCGAVDFVLRGLYDLHHTILMHWRKASEMYLVVNTTGNALLVLATGLAMVAGYYLFRGGIITIGTAYLLVQYTNLLARPIRELTQQAESLQNAGASTQRLAELRAIKSRTVDGPGAVIPDGPLGLTFDRVTFSYVENEPVLRDVSFRLEPGKVLGLLGRTGSGKTSLARLVFRLYDVTSGTIALGGVDVRQPTLSQLRGRVALVTQDVQLFQATLRDNLTFFDRSIADERILEVIETLGLTGWLATLPDGLDTELQSSGRGLSAGEGQLLAFTRVFLRNPGLVILDEASSRLDPTTEQLIERAVDHLLENRTAIVIAHRLDTVHRAGEIMILDQGLAVEHGPRAGLAADPNSRFHYLLQTGLQEVLA